MPYVLEDLIVDRVDLVDEGANSAAFIEIFKRKETTKPMDFSEILSKLKPEHAGIISKELAKVSAERDTAVADLTKAREDLATANSTITTQTAQLKKANDTISVLKAKEYCECDGEADDDGMCKACGKPKKKSTSFDETSILKSLPTELREEYMKMKAQKDAAEEQVRKAAEEKAEAEAVAKAATLKALPVEQDVLVSVLKSCDQSIVDILSAAAAAIEGTVLEEVGKSGNGAGTTTTSGNDAWDKIEAKAAEIAKRDSITKQKAIGVAIKENPDLYKDYLNGGAN